MVPDAAATRRAFALASVRSALTWRSQILWHALRTAVGVLLTFLVAWATVGPHDPLVTSMPTASFAILQISWTQTLVEYLFLLFAGVAIGLLLGFTVVPHLRPDRVEERVRLATETTTELLRGVALWVSPASGAPDRHTVPGSLVRPLLRMRTAMDNLGSPLNRNDERAGVQVERCTALATRFETLAIVGFLEAGEGRLSAQTLNAAADALVGIGADTPSSDEGEPEPAEFAQLAEAVGGSSTEFVAACAELTRGSS
ncbi:MAG: hypothetical protein ABI692_00515 [Terracoccus sp.]